MARAIQKASGDGWQSELGPEFKEQCFGAKEIMNLVLGTSGVVIGPPTLVTSADIGEVPSASNAMQKGAEGGVLLIRRSLLLERFAALHYAWSVAGDELGRFLGFAGFGRILADAKHPRYSRSKIRRGLGTG